MPSLSVFFFSSVDSGRVPDRYRFILRIASLAEELGFDALWIPERHFHPFGGLFPNPAVLAAALAVRTSRLALRAGSVVLPLHHVARVVEEWSLVDALSNGRVGLSLASGWNEGDFVLGNCAFADRRQYMLDAIHRLEMLWRGDEVGFTFNGTTHRVRTYPAPLRERPPLWLTATSGQTTFREAASRGLRVLTGYLQQGPQQLAENVRQYRDGFVPRRNGDRPYVTLMAHAYVAETTDEALAVVERPLIAYQRQFLDLAMRQARPGMDLAPLTDEEREALARHSAARYARECGLVGDGATVTERLRRLAGIGIDEVGCLVDFGLDEHEIVDTLTRLAATCGQQAGAANRHRSR